MPISDQLRARFQNLVTTNKVVLFMKGTRGAPACGFSAACVQILDEMLPSYETVNVLSDPEVRDGIKEFTSWPTIPQLYISGQFVGGSDILREMHASGELAKLLGVTPGEFIPPTITITPAAAKAIRDASEDAEKDLLHVEISPSFEYGLYFGPAERGEIEIDASGIRMVMNRGSAQRGEGLVIDFVEAPGGGGFKMISPLEPVRVKPLSVKDLKAWMDAKKDFELIDVRTVRERETASIAGSKLLDDEGEKALAALDKNTPIVFQCHHGIRSRSAAEHYLTRGFKNLYNLTGGIDAWSQQIDPKVPRY
jgi:monothiol glutaredoxin